MRSAAAQRRCRPPTRRHDDLSRGRSARPGGPSERQRVAATVVGAEVEAHARPGSPRRRSPLLAPPPAAGDGPGSARRWPGWWPSPSGCRPRADGEDAPLQRVVGGRLAQAGAGYSTASPSTPSRKRSFFSSAAGLARARRRWSPDRPRTDMPPLDQPPGVRRAARRAAESRRTRPACQEAVVKPSTSTPTPASSTRAPACPPARPAVRCGASSSPSSPAAGRRRTALSAASARRGTAAARRGWPYQLRDRRLSMRPAPPAARPVRPARA